MISAAKQQANKLNAQLSTGPRTPEGKSRVSQNNISFGLFSMRDYVRPEETEIYQTIRESLLADLQPDGVLELAHAAEILSATWRLRRCGILESSLSDSAIDPLAHPENAKLQAAIDRSRTQAWNLLRRATAALRELQSNRHAETVAPAEPIRTTAPVPSPTPEPQTPRNALCPCNSGQKFKRCCGRNAPGIFFSPLAA